MSARYASSCSTIKSIEDISSNSTTPLISTSHLTSHNMCMSSSPWQLQIIQVALDMPCTSFIIATNYCFQYNKNIRIV